MEVSSVEFEQNVKHYQDMAATEPVLITKDGKLHTVLMSCARYEILTKGRVAFKTEDLSPEQIQAITQSRMDPRHDHLNALLDE